MRFRFSTSNMPSPSGMTCPAVMTTSAGALPIRGENMIVEGVTASYPRIYTRIAHKSRQYGLCADDIWNSQPFGKRKRLFPSRRCDSENGLSILTPVSKLSVPARDISKLSVLQKENETRPYDRRMCVINTSKFRRISQSRSDSVGHSISFSPSISSTSSTTSFGCLRVWRS